MGSEFSCLAKKLAHCQRTCRVRGELAGSNLSHRAAFPYAKAGVRAALCECVGVWICVFQFQWVVHAMVAPLGLLAHSSLVEKTRFLSADPEWARESQHLCRGRGARAESVGTE